MLGATDAGFTDGLDAFEQLLLANSGHPDKGRELADRAALQAQRLNARVTTPASCCSIETVCDGYRLRRDDGTALMTRAVIVAVGVR